MTDLSPRQRQIVALVGRDGCQYQTVAKKLGISVHTVHAYVQRIRERVGIDKEPRLLMVQLYYSDPDSYNEAA